MSLSIVLYMMAVSCGRYRGERRRRPGWQWVLHGSSWQVMHKPQRCRRSRCHHHHSCTHALSEYRCWSVLASGHQRWRWAAGRCSGHVERTRRVASISRLSYLRLEGWENRRSRPVSEQPARSAGQPGEFSFVVRKYRPVWDLSGIRWHSC